MNPRREVLEISHRADGDRHEIVLSGELDLMSAGRLEALVAGLCQERARQITIELSKLEFVDSTGLRALVVSREICQAQECELSLAAPSRHLLRLLEITGLGGVLPIREGETDDSAEAGGAKQ